MRLRGLTFVDDGLTEVRCQLTKDGQAPHTRARCAPTGRLQSPLSQRGLVWNSCLFQDQSRCATTRNTVQPAIVTVTCAEKRPRQGEICCACPSPDGPALQHSAASGDQPKTILYLGQCEFSRTYRYSRLLRPDSTIPSTSPDPHDHGPAEACHAPVLR